MRRKLLIGLLIGILFIIVFFAAIFFMLPTDSIRHFAEKTLEKQLKQEQSVEIDDLSISPLLNVTVKGFQMRPRNPEEIPENLHTAGGDFNGYYCAPYVEEQAVTIDKAFINPKIIPSIKGKPEGKFELTIQEGTIEGEIRSQDNAMEITADGENISLNEFTLLSNITKMQIFGGLGFNLRAVVEKKSVAEMHLTMKITASALCPKRIKLDMGGMPFIELPFTVFGDIDAELDLQKDKITIEKLTSTGPDIQLNVTGDVTLKSNKNASPRLNIVADIHPSEEWVTNNNMKVIYQLCEKHDDGSIHLRLNGTTKKLKPDCGTPIPEPVPDPEQKEKTDSDEPKPEGDAAAPSAEEKPEKAPKEDTPKEEPPKEEPKDDAQPAPPDDNRPPRVHPDSVMKPERPLNKADLERQTGGRPQRTARPSSRSGRPSSELSQRAAAVNEKLDENIDREMRKRARVRGESEE